jgi:hypothetical protein
LWWLGCDQELRGLLFDSSARHARAAPALGSCRRPVSCSFKIYNPLKPQNWACGSVWEYRAARARPSPERWALRAVPPREKAEATSSNLKGVRGAPLALQLGDPRLSRWGARAPRPRTAETESRLGNACCGRRQGPWDRQQCARRSVATPPGRVPAAAPGAGRASRRAARPSACARSAARLERGARRWRSGCTTRVGACRMCMRHLPTLSARAAGRPRPTHSGPPAQLHRIRPSTALRQDMSR